MESKRSQRDGVTGVLLELGAKTPKRFEEGFAQLASFCDGAELIMRAPVDRMRRIAALTCTGVRNGKQYAVTCDVDLETDDLDAEAFELLAHFRRAVEFEDPEAVVDGRDPVPYRIPPSRSPLREFEERMKELVDSE